MTIFKNETHEVKLSYYTNFFFFPLSFYRFYSMAHCPKETKTEKMPTDKSQIIIIIKQKRTKE